ncbi:hypothetical protein A5700_00890 [Mycobacterium sp. E1214]|nr:hypothetical protein A5700_00890 [Mycobacterium sp. E1214]OBH28149.1 hypothetical protein A5693_22680 [Mycobacterium sp. E1319]
MRTLETMTREPATLTEEQPCIIRVALLEAFHYGEDAVLAAMNPTGLDVLTAALHDAQEHHASRLTCDNRIHTFQSNAGAADICLDGGRDDHVLWRLDPATIQEMIDLLTGMKGHGMCHNYVDIATPAQTLVLSVDEYLVPNAVVHTSPFGYF